MSSLVLENAAFAYPSRPDTPVLNGISVSLPLAGVSLILGGNGAGKTALARLMAGLDSPLSGSVSWPDGAEAAENRFRAGVVFEQPEFQFQSFSVAEELAGGLLYRGVERGAAERMAREGAERFGLSGLLDSDLSSLGTGSKLAVLVASFLILEPLLLVLDFSLTELEEPFRRTLLGCCGGERQPGLVVLSRHAGDLPLLKGASLFALSGGRLEPFPPDTGGPGVAEFLHTLGITLPWYAPADGSVSNAAGWNWLIPPAK